MDTFLLPKSTSKKLVSFALQDMYSHFAITECVLRLSLAEVLSKISEQVRNNTHGRLFAVLHVTNRQRRVTVEDIIALDSPMQCTIGDRIRLHKVRCLFPGENASQLTVIQC